MKFSSLSLLILTLTSCASKCPECDAGYSAMITFSNEVLKKNNWRLSGIGGGFDQKIHKLSHRLCYS
jgi:hypothetical protein